MPSDRYCQSCAQLYPYSCESTTLPVNEIINKYLAYLARRYTSGDPYQTPSLFTTTLSCACKHTLPHLMIDTHTTHNFICIPCHRWLPPQPDNTSCSPLPAHLDWTPSAHDTSCKEGWRKSLTRGNSLRLPHKASETDIRPKELLKSRSPSSPPFLGLFVGTDHVVLRLWHVIFLSQRKANVVHHGKLST